MVFVTERYRLLLDNAGIRDVRRSHDGIEQPPNSTEYEHRAKNADARDRVHARMKYLRHERLPAVRVVRNMLVKTDMISGWSPSGPQVRDQIAAADQITAIIRRPLAAVQN